jgi:ElaB/YqjD/DUF883 family membrane-anchored ribosome-binding protein
MSQWNFSQKPFLKAYPMATPTAKSTAPTTQQELKAAAELVLEKEEKRIRRAEMRARRQRRKREKEQLAAVHQMQQSIEVMKWCIVGIATVMFVGIILAIWTLSAVHDEVVKVQTDVELVRPQVENVINEVTAVAKEVGRVREALHNPMQSMGGLIGRELDQKIQSLMNLKSDTE